MEIRKSNIRIVIQCRLSSSRLPAKALLPIADIPTIVLCALRAGNSGLDVVVATSTEPTDEPLIRELARTKINYVRGPLEDVLTRFELATSDLSPNSIIVRLTADNVFPDGQFIEEMIQSFVKKDLDYLGTSSPIDGLPYGLSAEVFTKKALKKALMNATSVYDREHVTPFIKREFGANLFRPSNFSENLNHLRCTLDNLEDYLRLIKLFANIPNPIQASWHLLCEELSKLPTEPKYRVPFRVKNDLIHSELTLGTVQLGMPYGITNVSGLPSFDEAIFIMQQAILHGVTSIDSARIYGESEKRIGKALSDGYSDRVTVITKLDPLENLSPNDAEKNIYSAVDSSIFRSCLDLNQQSLQTLLLHRWEHRFSHKELIWKRLLELKNQGFIAQLGVSAQNPQEVIEALKDPEIQHIQLPFNILDWRWEHADIESLISKRSDVVIHARSALLQGILANKSSAWPQIQNIHPEHWCSKIEALTRELNRKNQTDLCFAYVRSKKWITSIVVGTETLVQLNENMKLFQNPPLTEEETTYVERTFEHAPEALLDPSQWTS